MMGLALEFCFAAPKTQTIQVDPINDNTKAPRFYQRCGFKPEGLRQFGEDLCLVHTLKRADWRSGD